jgi:hypothetical protein
MWVKSYPVLKAVSAAFTEKFFSPKNPVKSRDQGGPDHLGEIFLQKGVDNYTALGI